MAHIVETDSILTEYSEEKRIALKPMTMAQAEDMATAFNESLRPHAVRTWKAVEDAKVRP